ncbi:hypothetical protein [Clostridium sp. MD294]|uniref:hypothetical protein n=1 Tax=Clostridium sp. MD294 TaxID=97138 RepID=UPI0002CB8804|nr:hypothetical protein [Clostridium sp. MD294]NDO46209.1 hypothetical protein [Clostridium sp. MD294]USF30123.1 hypothetical protein C820_001564 [Clostridium sp. MD294]
MSINTIEYAKIFMEALDEQLIAGATSGWMEENSGQIQYTGGNEVKIPKIELNGLGTYDRDNGFVQGAVTLTYETKQMTQDRGRTFQLDAIDVDETNFALVAGNVMGEFQRTKVIPEIDAYRYSKIAELATESKKVSYYHAEKDSIVQKLLEEITIIKDIVGDENEVIVTMSTKIANLLDIASNHMLESGVFEQGKVELKVKNIDGSPIIRVPSARLKTSYQFFDGVTTGETEGGFEAKTDAKDINWIIAVRHALIGVSKTDVTRIFDPLTNQKANAWKIDYRKYHDLWIPDNAIEGIWVNIDGQATA